MPFYPWLLLARRLLLVQISYTVIRMGFLFNNWGQFRNEPLGQLTYAFFHGWRFDLWAVLWLNLPLVALTLLPDIWQRGRWNQLLTRIYYVSVNGLFIGLNVLDVELFHFTGKRMSMEWLHLQQDVREQSLGMIFYYWPYTMFFITLTAVVYRFYPKWRATSQVNQTPWFKAIAVRALGLVMVFLGLRGGTQVKPLDLPHAYLTGSVDIGVLTLNSTFTFLKNRLVLDELSLRFFKTDDEAREVLRQAFGRTSTFNGALKGYNVVVIIIESLGSEYVGAANGGHGYTPFLDTLAQRGQLFVHNRANGQRSVEAIPSVFCAVPSFMSEALILSPYQGVHLNCLGAIAREAGYSTIFFHGAHNGSMHVDALAARAGFSEFVGYNEFADKSQTDGYWGIFDEPFLLDAVQRLNRVSQPFAAGIFTLSSHSPYRIPDQHRSQFPKGRLEIHESIGYVDYALKEFFAAAEEQNWFKKTVFILTGDHTQKSEIPKYQTLVGRFHVPLWVYIPGQDQIRTDPERITQHVDILPTVLDLLGIVPEKMSLYGQSIFASTPGVTYSCNSKAYFLIDEKNRMVSFNSQQNTYEYSDVDSSLAKVPRSGDPERLKGRRLLEALIQNFNQSLLSDSLNQPTLTP